jgi:hypothetical protein
VPINALLGRQVWLAGWPTAMAGRRRRDYNAAGNTDASRRTVKLVTGRRRRSWTGATDGVWRDPDWLLCRDGRWRPVEPGTFPLADGIPGRMGLLRGYGNAIVPPLAAEFVTAFLESLPMPHGRAG